MLPDLQEWIASEEFRVGPEAEGREWEEVVVGHTSVRVFPHTGDELAETALEVCEHVWWAEASERRRVWHSLVSHLRASLGQSGPDYCWGGQRAERVATHRTLALLQHTPLHDHWNGHQGTHPLTLALSSPCLLLLAAQLAPPLLAGVRVRAVGTVETAPLLAYLRHLLARLGMPGQAVTLFIEARPERVRQSGLFLLAEQCDVEAAVEEALLALATSGVHSLLLLAHESLLPAVRRSFGRQVAQSGTQLRESGEVGGVGAGLSLLSFRTHGEALGLANHVRPVRFASLWCQRDSMAWNLAENLLATRQVSLNMGPVEWRHLADWHWELCPTGRADCPGDTPPQCRWPSLPPHRRASLLSPFHRTSPMDLHSLHTAVAVEGAVRHVLYYRPLGHIILHLDADPCPHTTAFCMEALLVGNTLTLLGPNSALAHWEPLKRHLDAVADSAQALRTRPLEGSVREPPGLLRLTHSVLLLGQSGLKGGVERGLLRTVRLAVAMRMEPFLLGE